LIVESRRIARLFETDALLHVVVIEEGHKIARRVAMGAEDILFRHLALLIHGHERAGRIETLHNRLQVIKQRII
jgi:hypothetical protein